MSIASLNTQENGAIKITATHIDNIRAGSTVLHEGLVRTVCRGDIKSGFCGTSLFGDSYRMGTLPVLLVELPSIRPRKVSA